MFNIDELLFLLLFCVLMIVTLLAILSFILPNFYITPRERMEFQLRQNMIEAWKYRSCNSTQDNQIFNQLIGYNYAKKNI
ncbi:MAG: hypothetical protein ACTSQY_00745 [Candidatus Odinarchaeia archaeon]